eukprot:6173600-Pleurochrysis_carterae.AAC.4
MRRSLRCGCVRSAPARAAAGPCCGCSCCGVSGECCCCSPGVRATFTRRFARHIAQRLPSSLYAQSVHSSLLLSPSSSGAADSAHAECPTAQCPLLTEPAGPVSCFVLAAAATPLSGVTSGPVDADRRLLHEAVTHADLVPHVSSGASVRLRFHPRSSA